MAEWEALWRDHQQARFPSAGLALEIDGVKLTKLDAQAGALVTASLRTDGRVRPLGEPRRRELEHHRSLILRALEELPLDPEGRAYFERLSALAERVLKG